MEISSEQNKPESVLPRWALALMSLLVLIVLIETAAVIYFSSRKPQNPVTEKPVKVTRYQPYSQAVSTSHPASYPVTYALSNRQHQHHWAQNNAAQHRTSGYDPFWTDAFTSLDELEERMNRLFDSFMVSSHYGFPKGNSFLGSQNDLLDFVPTVDLEEKEDHYLVKVDLPGLEKDKIDIKASGQLLTISGIRQNSSQSQDDHSGVFTQERSYGSFSRTISLPGLVEEYGIKAAYENGVLTVTLPKAAENKDSKKIAVQ